MGKAFVTAKWINKMAFETEINGHNIIMDAGPHNGGENRGPRPKPFMLAALGGCTGMDVISLLEKMRIKVDDFSVRVEGDQTEDYPKHYYRMHVIYEFTGKNLPLDKLERAVEMSSERYCGVFAVYKKAMEMTSEIIVHES
jgi:putative redox protein